MVRICHLKFRLKAAITGIRVNNTQRLPQLLLIILDLFASIGQACDANVRLHPGLAIISPHENYLVNVSHFHPALRHGNR